MNDREILSILWSVCEDRASIENLVPAINELEDRLAAIMKMPDRKIVLVDFDGVLHSYKSGWAGAAIILDGPLPGAIAWLESLLESPDLDVRIFSARCNDPRAIVAMIEWLRHHKIRQDLLEVLKFQPGKPKAHLIIDDRAVQFPNVTYATLNANWVANFEPWYYQQNEWKRK